MDNLALSVIVQLLLAFGLAGLFWPEKLMPVFGVLMFPWRASFALIRAHAIAAIGAYVLLLVKMFTGGR